MLRIKIEVPEKRDRAGFVQIVDGFTTVSEGVAVATSGFAVKGRGAARDHPPLGRYELTARAPTPRGAETEYGPQVLLFEPIAGPALEAESVGRFSVLLYAGSTGGDSFLRRTQGGVRLSRRAMEALLAHVRDASDADVELEIQTLTPPPWWAFWRKRKTPPSLSRDPPRLTAPPHDEATIAAHMLQSAIGRSRKPRREEPDDRDRWLNRDSRSDTSRDSASDFRGGGGSGGGGGASGAWTDAPAAGRGPGVNAAGMIVGAAGVAAIAAAAAERDSASGGNGNESSSGTDGDSGSAAADGGSSGTTTNTAY